mgnify:FL=1
MLTFIKEIFTWWNRQTFGTRIRTLIKGKLKGQDIFGNKYYEDKEGRRWVIYKDQIEASSIPEEWYSWIHHIKNKIENNHQLKKYKWQKPHQSNLTGTSKAYHPSKNKNAVKKKYNVWKI